MELIEVVMDSYSHETASDFARRGMELYARVADAIKREASIAAVADSYPDAVYIKAADSQIVYSNPVYNREFSTSAPAVGRYPTTFLHRSVSAVSQASDLLVLKGADQLEFLHEGCCAKGQGVLLRTFKKSLSSLACPNMAILGITRVERRLETPAAEQQHDICSAWQAVQQWDARDHLIARKLLAGQRLTEIAEELEVSNKTVENRRNAMYASLEVKSLPEFVKILVRLHDRGFGDFGL
ncbi:MAG: hypothetical protein D6753_01290 [Planctomycetota bacterium]|nr:MAG: hypothetical protein D6753_01290 [Planctomycetota bacterium]